MHARIPGMSQRAQSWVFRTSREECLKATCPQCKATPGEPCAAPLGRQLQSLHSERHEAAAVGGAKPVITREDWVEQQRWAEVLRVRNAPKYTNLRSDGW